MAQLFTSTEINYCNPISSSDSTVLTHVIKLKIDCG